MLNLIFVVLNEFNITLFEKKNKHIQIITNIKKNQFVI